MTIPCFCLCVCGLCFFLFCLQGVIPWWSLIVFWPYHLFIRLYTHNSGWPHFFLFACISCDFCALLEATHVVLCLYVVLFCMFVVCFLLLVACQDACSIS